MRQSKSEFLWSQSFVTIHYALALNYFNWCGRRFLLHNNSFIAFTQWCIISLLIWTILEWTKSFLNDTRWWLLERCRSRFNTATRVLVFNIWIFFDLSFFTSNWCACSSVTLAPGSTSINRRLRGIARSSLFPNRSSFNIIISCSENDVFAVVSFCLTSSGSLLNTAFLLSGYMPDALKPHILSTIAINR